MSFLSILKKIGSVSSTVIGIEHTVSPLISTFVPGFAKIDDILQKIPSAVVAVEQAVPADGQGQAKSDAVVADFQSGLSFVQDILAMEGKTLAYDPAALQDAISSQVSAFNAMAALKGSFKIASIAPATPVPVPDPTKKP